jgi:fatty acid desaturase
MRKIQLIDEKKNVRKALKIQVIDEKKNVREALKKVVVKIVNVWLKWFQIIARVLLLIKNQVEIGMKKKEVVLVLVIAIVIAYVIVIVIVIVYVIVIVNVIVNVIIMIKNAQFLIV